MVALVLGFAAAMIGCSDAPRGEPTADITLADLNILHGAFCPPETDHCRLPERMDLLLDHIALRGCPDVVALEEVWTPAIEALRPRLTTVCPFAYDLVQGERVLDIDDETVLTRYPVIEVEQRFLLRGFRRVLRVRIAHPFGPLDVYATHLASGSDGAETPCGAACPAECVAAGASTVRDCQAVQVAQFVEQSHDVPQPAILAGDFNDSPGSFAYRQLVGRGWIDTYLAAGNPECNPPSGIGCTSGRADEVLTDLEAPVRDETERIDFVFLVPPAAGASCRARLDAGDQGKPGRGAATRLFADVANPFAASCGSSPTPICWPSDHIGMQLSIACDERG